MTRPTKEIGRPTLYSEELAKLICDRVATHTVGLPTLCKMYQDLPDKDTINEWRYRNQDFSAKYAEAKRFQAELMAEEIIELSDNSSMDTIINEKGKEIMNHEWVARSRLRVDSRKWLASKLAPKIYGDRLQLEQKTEENEKLKEEVAALRVELDAKNIKDY